MKMIIQHMNTIILRFDNGDDVIKGLNAFCDEQNIQAAYFTGIGACASTTLSYYNLEKKRYVDKKFEEDLEIVALTGNVAKLKNDSIIHMHGVFGDKKYLTIGGHVKKLVVSATCEIHLTVLHEKMNRSLDNATGLNLLQ